MNGARGWTVGRRLAVALGAVALLLAADLGLGMAWGALFGSPDSPSTTRAEWGERFPLFEDDRADHPAMADAPWAEQLFSDFAHLRYEYVPFLYPRVAETHTRYVNASDGIRRSYEPSPSGVAPLEVWMFGGSTTWGDGQRDLHTIASEIARTAEADGLPVRVSNFGQPGWASWQEMLAFERALAHRGPPDMAIFYDGVNEFEIQRQEGLSEDPIPFQAASTAAAVDIETMVSEGQVPADERGSISEASTPLQRGDWALGALVERYGAESVSGRLWQGLSGVFGVQAAGAQSADTDEVIVANAVGIYRRAQAMIQLLAEREGVEVASFWQPRLAVLPGYEEALTELGPDVVDLTGVLDDEPPDSIYIDAYHTNERGARIVAEAIWADIGPRLLRLADG